MKLTIDFEPVPKGRPRFKFFNGQAITYTPIRTQEAQDGLHILIAKLCHDSFPKHMPLKMTVIFYRRKSKWLPKYETLPMRKPDLVNFEVLLDDAIPKSIMPDDAQITSCNSKKRWSPTGKGYIELTLEEDKL
jgi:Holliday junction resolvase RusA-like endonuclease